MPSLFGRVIGRNDLLKRVGDLSQVAGIRMMTLADGPERGVRIADARTGSGLRFQVTLDRGMDLSVAEYPRVPLAFRTPVGDAHPALFESEGRGWLRTFAGGLMTGCGMTSAGAPSSTEGRTRVSTGGCRTSGRPACPPGNAGTVTNARFDSRDRSPSPSCSARTSAFPASLRPGSAVRALRCATRCGTRGTRVPPS